MSVFTRWLRMSPRPDHKFRPAVESLDARDVPAVLAPTPAPGCDPGYTAPPVTCPPVTCPTAPSPCAPGLSLSVKLGASVSIGGSSRLCSTTPSDGLQDLLALPAAVVGQLPCDLQQVSGLVSGVVGSLTSGSSVGGLVSGVVGSLTNNSPVGGLVSGVVGSLTNNSLVGGLVSGVVGSLTSGSSVGGLVSGVVGSLTNESPTGGLLAI